MKFLYYIPVCCLIILCSTNITAKTLTVKDLKPISVSGGLSAPVGMAFDSSNNLYISNWSADNVVTVTKNGTLKTVVTGINSPSGVAVSKSNHIYIASYSQGEIYRANLNKRKKNKTIRATLFCKGLSVPAGINFDSRGNLIVADRGRGEIIQISPDATKKTLVKNLKTPVGVIELPNDKLVISTFYGDISVFDKRKKSLKTISNKLVSPAVGLAVDPTKENSVLAVDYGASDLYRINLNGNIEVLCSSVPQPVALTVSSAKWAYIATWGDNHLYKTKL